MPGAVFLDPDRPDEAALWQALWARDPHRTPFTHAAFARALAAATGRKAVLAAVEGGEGLAAGAVLYPSPRLRNRVAGPAPSTRYTGVLMAEVPGERARLQGNTPLDALLAAIGGRYPVAALSLAPHLSDVRPFGWKGFTCTPRYTYEIAREEPYQPDSATRRRARQLPDAHAEAVAPDDASFADLLLRHYAARGARAPIPAARLRVLMQALHAAGLLECTALRGADGGLLAAHATLVLPQQAFLWMLGSLPGAAMPVLQDALVRRLHAEGRTVDLMGANHAGIAAFKHHFGGALRVHYHAVYHRNPFWRALDAARPLA